MWPFKKRAPREMIWVVRIKIGSGSNYMQMDVACVDNEKARAVHKKLVADVGAANQAEGLIKAAIDVDGRFSFAADSFLWASVQEIPKS